MRERTHWLVALVARDPDGLVRALRAEGYDAARATSTIAAVPAAPERPAQRAARCAAWGSAVVFVPAYPEMPEAERDRLAAVIAAEPVRAAARAP